MISKSASISLQQAYNLKKESRMKIIQKMESLKDKNSQLPTTKGNGEDAI